MHVAQYRGTKRGLCMSRARLVLARNPVHEGRQYHGLTRSDNEAWLLPWLLPVLLPYSLWLPLPSLALLLRRCPRSAALALLVALFVLCKPYPHALVFMSKMPVPYKALSCYIRGGGKHPMNMDAPDVKDEHTNLPRSTHGPSCFGASMRLLASSVALHGW